GFDGIDGFLKTWIPRLTRSPAYAEGMLIVITFDEGGKADACCNEPAGYNTVQPGLTGAGGGRTGTILLGSCIAAGSEDPTPYNHYGLLRTLEDLWALPHLGYAGQDGLAPIALAPCKGPA